jgi:hypothetical protein
LSLRMIPIAPMTPMRGTPPGTIMRTEHDGIQHLIMCPCGCGEVSHSRHAVKSGSVEEGNLTLTPSLVMSYTDEAGQVHGCGWHGFLTDGIFTSV